jgi:Putative zinc-finger domain
MPTKVVQPSSATLFLREQVKDALRSLESHNIKYDELVGEGVDPYLLRKLYEELKKETAQENLSSSDMDAQGIFAAQYPAQGDPRQPDDLSGPMSGDSGQTMQASETAGTISVLTPDHSTSRSTKGEGLIDPSKAPSPVEVRTEKPPVVPALSNTAMERKDRIAQLLAAKTGRAVAPRLPAEIPPQLPIKSPKPETPAEAPKKPLSLPEKPPAPSSEQSVKVKNKAQTELIRQKMEALKKEALARVQAQDAAKAVSVVSSPASELPSNAVHAQQPAPTAEIGSTEFVFQIPGLFMTNEAHSNAPDTKNVEKVDSPIEMLNDPISISSTSDNISQRTSAERDNDSVRTPGGHTLPMRLPQKRPLASDSFDEQMPALKRPFGRKDSHGKVEIVLSEAESEGEVEDVEMELDEESDEEQQTTRNDLPPVSRPQSNIRNLPALTDFPSPRPVAPLASGIATPTSSAIQTPGREKEKEELWKAKNQEIELMRKKIAEMEERRKAKQNATRAISPKAAGKPIIPVIRTSLTRPSNSESPGLAKPLINAEASASSGILISPMLPASRPEELPSTPSTPLHAIKEPLKAEDLRQKLLRRKTIREGTPNTAEMEIRQAQLAEKRAKLAELRREAERREAEILEETRMLEAQLQAGLDEHESYEDGPSTENGYFEEDSNAMEPKSKDASFAADVDPQDGVKEGCSPVQSSSPMRTQGSPLETFPDQSPSRADTVPRSSAEEGIVDEGSGMVHTMSSMATNLDAKRQAPQELSVRPRGQDVETAIIPPPDDTSSMSIHGTGRMDDVDSPSSLNEDELADDAPPNTFEADSIDEDGSVSMSDSVSEDYEPAEPEQIEDDQAENDSEPYEPAEVPVTVNEVQQPTFLQDKLDEPITVDTPIPEAPPQSTSPLHHQSNQPIYIDDSEDGMQLTEPDVINKPQVISQSPDDGNSDNVRTWTFWSLQSDTILQVPQPISYFTPYETPRKYFKNFRYHDRFPETVASGYKSLTFSNSIDPRKPFCPTELAGQACQDPNCKEQHFRQVALTGACGRSSQPLHYTNQLHCPLIDAFPL